MSAEGASEEGEKGTTDQVARAEYLVKLNEYQNRRRQREQQKSMREKMATETAVMQVANERKHAESAQIGYGSEFEIFYCVFTALNTQAGGDCGHVQFRGQSRLNDKLWICCATYERNPAANASWELSEEDESVPKIKTEPKEKNTGKGKAYAASSVAKDAANAKRLAKATVNCVEKREVYQTMFVEELRKNPNLCRQASHQCHAHKREYCNTPFPVSLQCSLVLHLSIVCCLFRSGSLAACRPSSATNWRSTNSRSQPLSISSPNSRAKKRTGTYTSAV
eukprot:1577162-Pleurochrysis_carterae.AAC.1